VAVNFTKVIDDIMEAASRRAGEITQRGGNTDYSEVSGLNRRNIAFVLAVVNGLIGPLLPLQKDGDPGTLNERKQLNRLIDDTETLRQVLSSEFAGEVSDNADWGLEPPVTRAVRVMRVLREKLVTAQDKLMHINRDREQFESEREEVEQYINETFPVRAGVLKKGGCDTWQMLVIGMMENLRDELESIAGTKEPRPDARHDKPMIQHAVDTMAPETRRNVTLNDLRAMLRDMLFSGVDVAVKHLDSFLEGYVTAVDITVRRSVELEQNEEYSPTALVKFMVWLRDEYTGDFDISQKAAELLAQVR
jgi:hypothetical protein